MRSKLIYWVENLATSMFVGDAELWTALLRGPVCRLGATPCYFRSAENCNNRLTG